MSVALAVIFVLVASVSTERAGAAPQARVLYSFHGKSDGYAPSGTLIADSSGNLYGTTQFGGDASCRCGTVFELLLKGSRYVTKTLYSFEGGADGAMPQFGVIADASGALYGTTVKGGPRLRLRHRLQADAIRLGIQRIDRARVFARA